MRGCGQRRGGSGEGCWRDQIDDKEDGVVARIRSIYPSFKHDSKVKRLSREARLLFVLMLPESDDEGRMPGSGKWLAGTLYEDDHDVTASKVLRWLSELIREGMVQPYEHDGAKFLLIVNFKKYQHPKKPSPSRLPPPPGTPPSTPPSGEPTTPPTTPPSTPAGWVPSTPLELGSRSIGSRSSSSSSVSGEPATPLGPEEEDEEVEAEVERRLASSRSAGTKIANVKAWKAKTRASVLTEIAENGRSVLDPPKPKPPDPTELTAAAQRERAERNEARLRGEACVACDGSGWVLAEDDDVAEPCRACGPNLSVVGQ